MTWLLLRVFALRGVPEAEALVYSWLWCLNPLVAVVSCRGNADSLIAAMVLGSAYLFLTRRLGVS